MQGKDYGDREPFYRADEADYMNPIDDSTRIGQKLQQTFFPSRKQATSDVCMSLAQVARRTAYVTAAKGTSQERRL